MARFSLPSADQVPGGRGFAALSRRVRTLIVTGVLFLVLFVLALTLPVPYVILSPGPTYNTLGTHRGDVIISIDGRSVNATSGHLNMTTVSVTTDPISAFQAFAGWLFHDEVVVPRSSVYPPGQSEQEANKQNTQDFIESQDSAKVAALCELHYPRAFGVVSVLPSGPSMKKLRSGDSIVSVAGKPADNADKLRAVIETQQAGDTVPVVVEREKKRVAVRVTLAAAPAGQKGARLGIQVADTCLAPFTVDLGLANEIGGPSAGLMFALGIIDKVGSVELTGGKFIAGTGTIDPQGKVGPIGGIALKMIAARAKGATVFLAPAGNCDSVRNAIPRGLEVVKVDTLHGAVQDLEKLKQGQTVPHC